MPDDLVIQAMKTKCTDALIASIRSNAFSEQDLKEKLGDLHDQLPRAIAGQSSILNLLRLLTKLGHDVTIVIGASNG